MRPVLTFEANSCLTVEDLTLTYSVKIHDTLDVAEVMLDRVEREEDELAVDVCGVLSYA